MIVVSSIYGVMFGQGISQDQMLEISNASAAKSIEDFPSSSSSDEEKIEEAKPFVSRRDEQGNNELHRVILSRQQDKMPEVALKNMVEKIKGLLEQEVNPNVQNKKGDTVLHLIADLPYWGEVHEELIRVLLNHNARADIKNLQGNSALHNIISKNPSPDVVKDLLEQGFAKVNEKNNSGDTPLHIMACTEGSLRSAFNVKVAEELLGQGADVNLKNNQGNTPLHAAILGNHTRKATEFLISQGKAKINEKNNKEDTPLNLLAAFNSSDKCDHRDIVEFFLKNGADKTIRNQGKYLPYDKAKGRWGSTVLDLLQVGENRELVNTKKQTPLHKAVQLSEKSIDDFCRELRRCDDVNVQDELGNTPLHYAAKGGFYQALTLLVEQKAAIDLANTDGDSPLFLAVRSLMEKLYPKITNFIHCEEIGEIITTLKEGSDPSKKVRFKIDTRNLEQQSTLLKRVINLLLDNGSNPNQTNRKGESAVSFCLNWINSHASDQFKAYFKTMNLS